MQGILENYKKYLYYVWMADLGLTYTMSVFSSKPDEEENDFDDITPTKEQISNSNKLDETKDDIEHHINPELLKMMQMQKDMEKKIFVSKDEQNMTQPIQQNISQQQVQQPIQQNISQQVQQPVQQNMSQQPVQNKQEVLSDTEIKTYK